MPTPALLATSGDGGGWVGDEDFPRGLEDAHVVALGLSLAPALAWFGRHEK